MSSPGAEKRRVKILHTSALSRGAKYRAKDCSYGTRAAWLFAAKASRAYMATFRVSANALWARIMSGHRGERPFQFGSVRSDKAFGGWWY